MPKNSRDKALTALKKSEAEQRRLAGQLAEMLNKLQLPGIDLGAAKRLVSSAAEAIKQGRLGYVLIGATKPNRQD